MAKQILGIQTIEEVERRIERHESRRKELEAKKRKIDCLLRQLPQIGQGVTNISFAKNEGADAIGYIFGEGGKIPSLVIQKNGKWYIPCMDEDDDDRGCGTWRLVLIDEMGDENK